MNNVTVERHVIAQRSVMISVGTVAIDGTVKLEGRGGRDHRPVASSIRASGDRRYGDAGEQHADQRRRHLHESISNWYPDALRRDHHRRDNQRRYLGVGAPRITVGGSSEIENATLNDGEG